MNARKRAINIGSRVVITGECKSKGRVGTITNFSPWEGLYSVHLDATSDKRGCGIRVAFRNVKGEV